jgi:aspartyl-tRNA(Asn)/glutamyl-tRNA(Gln) amidotransferase subunit B
MNPAVLDRYEPVIGLEVHAQLSTVTKMFTAVPYRFGVEPNTLIDPVVLALPGVLPVVNREAVAFAVKLALAVGGRIRNVSRFARKHYFYPDLPKGYQISQYDEPYCDGGSIELELADGARRRIELTRIHLEEDSGKNMHADAGANFSLVDYNRAGVPLVEIVSEPVIRSAAEAVGYLKALRQILRTLGICDGNLEEGSMRCDANVSIRPRGAQKLGTRTEMKNLNSFKAVSDAIEFEIERQAAVPTPGAAWCRRRCCGIPHAARPRCCAPRKKPRTIDTSPSRTCRPCPSPMRGSTSCAATSLRCRWPSRTA